MPTTITHSISNYVDGDFLDEVSLDSQMELVKRRGTNGTFKKGKIYNPTSEFSIKGGGAPAAVAGLATLSITNLSGGVKYITKSRYTQKNSDFDDFENSGEHLPNATDQG